MTRAQLAEIISGRRPITRSLTIILAKTLSDVLERANDPGPATNWEGLKSAPLAYKTANRALSAIIELRELPDPTERPAMASSVSSNG